MNRLEQYIVEVHSVTPYTEEWTDKFPGDEFVKVDVTRNCYGSKKRVNRIWTTEEWNEILNNGYWME